MTRVAALIRELAVMKITIQMLDAGGGLGIDYQRDEPVDEFAARARKYAQAITEPLRGMKVRLLLEPGRSLVARSGALLTRVLYIKQNGGKRFAVVDAAMNDLIRPSLYQAHHRIVPATLHERGAWKYDVVGPICETGDFFARDRGMQELHAGDLVAILDAGAYGMSLGSNYNSRPRAAEVLVSGRKAKLIRKRETMRDLMAAEL
jgi:diaminopimelate decarboxylase